MSVQLDLQTSQSRCKFKIITIIMIILIVYLELVMYVHLNGIEVNVVIVTFVHISNPCLSNSSGVSTEPVSPTPVTPSPPATGNQPHLLHHTSITSKRYSIGARRSGRTRYTHYSEA